MSNNGLCMIGGSRDSSKNCFYNFYTITCRHLKYESNNVAKKLLAVIKYVLRYGIQGKQLNMEPLIYSIYFLP